MIQTRLHKRRTKRPNEYVELQRETRRMRRSLAFNLRPTRKRLRIPRGRREARHETTDGTLHETRISEMFRLSNERSRDKVRHTRRWRPNFASRSILSFQLVLSHWRSEQARECRDIYIYFQTKLSN